MPLKFEVIDGPTGMAGLLDGGPMQTITTDRLTCSGGSVGGICGSSHMSGRQGMNPPAVGLRQECRRARGGCAEWDR